MSGSRTEAEAAEARASLERLATAIALGDGFAVHLLVCDDARVAAQAVIQVAMRARELRGQPARIVRLSPYAPGRASGPLTLADLSPVVIEPLLLPGRLARAAASGDPLIVVVDATGAPRADELAWHNAFGRMNEVRNTIRAHVPGALLICVPRWLESAFSHNAADFWSIRGAAIALPPGVDLSADVPPVVSDAEAILPAGAPLGAPATARPAPVVRGAGAAKCPPPLPATPPASPGPPAWPDVTILHLADLQLALHGQQAQRHAFRAFLDDVGEAGARLGRPIDLVCISGDLAYSGQAEEYELAEAWFLDPLLGRLGLERGRVAMTPGNHDIEREVVRRAANLEASMAFSLRELEEEQVSRTVTSGTERRQVMKRLRNYAAFTSRFFGGASDPSADGQLFSTRAADIRGVRAGIACLNSVWLVGDGDGQALLGRAQVQDALAQLIVASPAGCSPPARPPPVGRGAGDPTRGSGERAPDLAIALLHHPVEALADASAAAEALDGFDLVLHGHVHAPAEAVPRRAPAAGGAPGRAVHCGAPPLLKRERTPAYSLIVLGGEPHVEIRRLSARGHGFERQARMPLPARAGR